MRWNNHSHIHIHMLLMLMIYSTSSFVKWRQQHFWRKARLINPRNFAFYLPTSVKCLLPKANKWMCLNPDRKNSTNLCFNTHKMSLVKETPCLKWMISTNPNAIKSLLSALPQKHRRKERQICVKIVGVEAENKQIAITDWGTAKRDTTTTTETRVQ